MINAAEYLDKIEEPVYLADRETYVLQYVNEAGRKKYGIRDEDIGKKCYEVLKQRTGPCSMCSGKDGTMSQQAEDVLRPLKFNEQKELKDARKIMKAQKEQMESSNRIYRALLETLPGGVSVYDAEIATGRVTTVDLNESVSSMMGYEKEELFAIIRNNALALIHPDDLPNIVNQVQAVIQGRKRLFEQSYRSRNKNGKYQWVHIKAKIVERNENFFRFYSVMNDVDVIKQSEQAARIENEKFRIALEHSRGYIWDYDLETDDTAKNHMVVTEESLCDWEELHREIRTGQERSERKICFYTPEGTKRWYDCRYTTIFGNDGKPLRAIGFAEDITAAIVQERDLRDELAKLQEICNFTLEQEYKDIVLIDVPGNRAWVYYAKGKAADRQYIPDYENSLQKMLLFVCEEDREKCNVISNIASMLRTLDANGGELSFVYRMKLAGNPRWMEYKAIYFNRDKQTVLSMTRDIHEDKLREISDKARLEEALEKAEKAANAKQEFLSHMSHEIRTPLNGIKGLLDILKERPQLKEDKYISDAIVSTTHLMSIVNNILDMSKVNSGKLSLQHNWIPRSKFIRQVLAVAEPMAAEKGITLTYRSQINDDTMAVYIDIARMKQVLWNLLSNAIKYTPGGGRVEYSSEVKELGNGMGSSVTHIRDSGIGMTPEFIQIAFEPFSQEERDMTQVGTGLGLAITKQLVEAMGGSITVNSVVGEGTDVCIAFTVPMRLYTGGEDKSSLLAEGSITDYRNYDFSGIRCLMAEDNDINREIARVQLESVGLEVTAVMNGEEALEAFVRSSHGYYGILFMDIMMPVKDGLTAVREIRALDRPDALTVPIVAMTANAFIEDVHKSLENGMNYHLSKPFEKIQILEILAKEFADRS